MKSGLDYLHTPFEDDDYEYSRDDLRKQINEYDRSYGLRLKHPENCDFDLWYMDAKHVFTEELMDNIHELNSIKINTHHDPKLFVSGAMNRGGSIEGDYIFQTSPLWNGARTMEPILSEVFKARFLTLLYSEMAKYLDDIVDMEFGHIGNSVTKSEQRYAILQGIIDATTNFHDAYIKNQYSLDASLRLVYYLSFRSKKKRNKVLELISEHMGIIYMNQTWSGNNLDDDVLMNDLAKIAYMAVTENPDIENTTPTMLQIDIHDDRLVRKVLTGLGEDILFFKNRRKKHPHPFLYEAFLYARPSMPTRFTDVSSNIRIRIAVRALYYLGFLANDSSMMKLIQKIV